MQHNDSKKILQYFLLENSSQFNLYPNEVIESNYDQLLDMIPLYEGESSGDWKIDFLNNLIQKIKDKKEVAKRRLDTLREEITKLNKDIKNKKLNLTPEEINVKVKEIADREAEIKRHIYALGPIPEKILIKAEKEIKERKVKLSSLSGRWELLKLDTKELLSKFPQIKKYFYVGSLVTLSAVLLALVAIMFYKLFFTPAQRACSGKSGAEKDTCIKNFKRQALEEVIKRLEDEKALCSTSIRPDLCNRRIDEEIGKWVKKLQNV